MDALTWSGEPWGTSKDGDNPMNVVTETTNAQRRSVFSRVLVGVDGSEESLEAARQAAVLADGALSLLAVYDIAPVIGGTGTRVPYYLDEDLQREAATGALRRAWEDVAMALPTGKIVRGRPATALISEVERERDTLLVVGSHGQGRMAGFVMGSTATEVIHKAPCSVLVARRRHDEFPNKVVVGVDGSPESAAAYAVAGLLSERFNAQLRAVVAHGGKAVDRRLVDLIVDHRREDLLDEPVAALVAAATSADLLVVGSRGPHGLRALGSVSERVAHRAHSSVLVVRRPSWGVSEELRDVDSP
jgi:nucleotide-binding universal stress UspA family protein